MIRQRTERGNREHQFVSDHLSEYIDEQLSDRDRRQVEAHLATCADCRADLHSLRWTQRLLRQAPAVKVPRSFVLREGDVAPRPAAPARLRLIAVQWATAAVALLFVLVLGIDLFAGAGLRGARQPQAAMLAETAPQTVEETVIETTVVEQERAAPSMPSGGGGTQDTPTAESEATQLAAAPTPTGSAAKLVAPRDEATATPAPAAEAMATETAAETPTPAPAAEAGAAEAAPETPAPKSTDAPLMAQVPEEPPGERAAAPDTELTAPPQAEPETLSTQAYGADRQQEPGRVAWWIAEAVLGAALLILVGTLIWLRRQA